MAERGSTWMGAVLAGGQSRRYGRPKWEAAVSGRSLGERARDALLPHVAELVVSGDSRAAEALGLPFLADQEAGLGPVGGLLTVLREARDRGHCGVAVLACDLPFVDTVAVGELIGQIGHTEAAVLADDTGIQPTAAVYTIAVIDQLENAVSQGCLALRDLAAVRDAIRVDVTSPPFAIEGAPVLLNVNRPLDRIRAESHEHDGPPLVCVVGKKNSGKTGLTVALAAELRARGLRVMTVKHGHGFDLDREGTDSWRHREEGEAERVLMVGPEGMAMVGKWGSDGERPLRELVDDYLGEADVVVAEGWKVGPDAKIDVFRKAAHDRPVFDPTSESADTFLATVTDVANYEAPHAVFQLSDPDHIERLADLLIETLLF